MKYLYRLAFFYFLLCAPVMVFAEAVSGYKFVTEETRIMQDDDFSNPGLISVDRGEELFNEKHIKEKTSDNKSCADCHGAQGEKLDVKKISNYPVYDSKNKEIITLQKRINNCRENIESRTLTTDHPDLVALEAFVRNRAKATKINIETGEPVEAFIKKGELLYNTRYGLIDMSCNHCHNLYTGQMIRGQKISQGQGNGFPTYRLATGEITNLHQRIQQCMTLLRAEPFETDSEELKLLGLYIMSRSNGLDIETPAVRY